MAGKKQTIKRKRTSTPRLPFRLGPKTDRKKFLNEMKRSNNIIRALAVAQIRWAGYQEWLDTGFVTESMLAEADFTFKLKHPTIDMLASTKSDQELEDAGLGVAATEATSAVEIPLELHGYSPKTILDPSDWKDINGYDNDV